MEDQDYILFENYLSKTLSLDEVEAFETRLKTDSEFNQSFITYKELSSFLEHKFEKEEASKTFKSSLEQVSNNYFNNFESDESVSGKKEKSKTFNFYKYGIAASIALLFGVFMFNQFSNPTYGDFANHDTISLTVRGEQKELLQAAENAFNSENYEQAEDAFQNLIELDNENSELKFYRAITNIELNKFDVADKLLENLSIGNSAFKNKALWYLALSKLKQKDNSTCIEVLKTIPEDADNYKQAQKLLKTLD